MASVLETQIRTAELARAGRLVARIATHPDEIEAAQRLRWRVFSEEFGCADLPMLLALDRVEARYSRRFLRSA